MQSSMVVAGWMLWPDWNKAGFPGRRPGRGAQSQDRGFLPGVHSAISGTGRRLPGAAVRDAGPDFGDTQHFG